MSEKPDHDPTPIVIAYQWAVRLMTVAAEMVVPGVLGYWVDGWLGTKIVFVLLGFGAGCALGMWHLVQMTSSMADSGGPQSGGQRPGDERGRR